MIRLLLLVTLLCGAFSAQARPAVDPRAWQRDLAGPPTQVLTLGSPHLSQLPVPVTSAMLEPLLDKLVAFRPDIITVEALSGEQCDLIARAPATYPDVHKTYCRDTQAAATATGLDVPGAMAAIAKTLGAWPASPTAAERRRLASLFLAANDRASAQVQWLRLPAAERRAGDGLDAALVEILKRTGSKPNETFDIAVALAVRLGHDRVFAVDDHTSDAVQASGGPGFEPDIQAHWAGIAMPLRDQLIAREKALATGSDVLDLYRTYNMPETLRTFVEVDFRDALKRPAPFYGRQYVAWYEVRNLRMVANIRAAFANRPGARVLNVVGSSHKPYYDAYLGMMSEVALVDAETVLR